MTQITIYNVQRAITPKVGKPQLWFLCSACCLMVVNIHVNFHENISNGFQGMGRTRFYDQTKFMVLVFCTLSRGVNISVKISRTIFKLLGGHDFVTDGQTSMAKAICLAT